MSSEATHEVARVVGNAHARQRGSGHSVVLMIPWVPGHSAGQNACWESGRRDRQTRRRWGVCEQALQPHRVRKGLSPIDGVQGRGQNRIREIRPSGIVGGLAET